MYTVSLTAYQSVMYLAMVGEVEIILCFLLLHKTIALLMKKQYFMTDF